MHVEERVLRVTLCISFEVHIVVHGVMSITSIQLLQFSVIHVN